MKRKYCVNKWKLTVNLKILNCSISLPFFFPIEMTTANLSETDANIHFKFLNEYVDYKKDIIVHSKYFGYMAIGSNIQTPLQVFFCSLKSMIFGPEISIIKRISRVQQVNK